jgi:protein O-mannosyl-transferase
MAERIGIARALNNQPFDMPKKYNTIFLVLALAAVYMLYQAALAFPFVFDDHQQIALNSHLSSWSYLKVYFTQNVWSHLPDGAPGANYYRPLFLVWLRLNFILFGQQPTGWHWTTIALHLLATGLVYLLVVKLFRNSATAILAALIFGIHPAHVEAVAWISGVTEPLCAVLVLAALLCYVNSVQEGRPYGLAWRVASLFFFLLAVLAKETAAVLPLLILLYELTLSTSSRKDGLQPIPRRLLESARRCAWFFSLTAGYLVARFVAIGGLLHRNGSSHLYASLLRCPWLLTSYVRMLLWPAKLSVFYDPIEMDRFTDFHVWLPVLIVLSGFCVLWNIRRLRSAGITYFLAGWFLITLAPALILSCLTRPSESFQDRYTYLPSVAFAIAAAVAVRWFYSAAANSAVRVVSAAWVFTVLAMLALVTWNQVQFWKSDYVLFARAVAIAPHNEIARQNLAFELNGLGRFQEAERLAKDTVRFSPASAQAYASLAASAFYMKDYAVAEQNWSIASRINPKEELYWRFLGAVRIQLGDYPGALTALDRDLVLDPTQLSTHYLRGLVLAKLDRQEEACGEFRRELALGSRNQMLLAAYQPCQHLENN